MQGISPKFKFLEDAESLLPRGSIPQYRFLSPHEAPSSLLEECKGMECILRSGLRSEGGGNEMLSGKSISTGGIRSLEELQAAHQAALSQPGLQTLLLQKEIQWERHLTLWVEDHFMFVQERDRGGRSKSFYSDPLTRSGAMDSLREIEAFLDPLEPLLRQNPHWLLEIGSVGSTLYLFQIQVASHHFLEHVFSSDLAFRLVLARNRFQRLGSLPSLLRTEWNAFHFRRRIRGDPPRFSDVFSNWEFLFHYFRIFCMTRRIVPDAGSFSEFLSLAHNKNTHWGSLVHEHLAISRVLRKSESDPEMETAFNASGPLYIGKGILCGTFGVDIFWQEEPDVQLIHSIKRPKAILTPSVSILSHFALACAELGVGLVMGLESEPRDLFQHNAELQIDFHKRSITLR